MSEDPPGRPAPPAEAAPPLTAEMLLAAVYEELRDLARVRLRDTPAGQSLSPTELVHEAFLKMAGGEAKRWASRKHFVDAAGVTMRSVLVDRARAKLRAKRGGGARPGPLPEDAAASPTDEQVVFVNDALGGLTAEDPRAAEVVTMRFFLGMSDGEIAELLGVTSRTVRRDWLFARTWLHGRMLADDQ